MFESALLRFTSESTLLIEFDNTLSAKTHQRVLQVDAALARSDLHSIIEVLPTLRSLLLRFDPFQISHNALLEALSTVSLAPIKLSSKDWQLAVCFEGPSAEDLAEVSDQLSIAQPDIINRLVAAPLTLYMVGFAPGFSYLGGLDASLAIPRRQTPRAPMPENSLMIGGGLASLSSVSMPTGWYVVGRTPITLFNLEREPMLPFEIGDRIHMYAIDTVQFSRMRANNAKNSDELQGLLKVDLTHDA